MQDANLVIWRQLFAFEIVFVRIDFRNNFWVSFTVFLLFFVLLFGFFFILKNYKLVTLIRILRFVIEAVFLTFFFFFFMMSIILAKCALSNSCFGVNPEDKSNHRLLVKPKTPIALAKSMLVARQLLGILPLVESLAAAFEAAAIPEKDFLGAPSSVCNSMISSIWSYVFVYEIQSFRA